MSGVVMDPSWVELMGERIRTTGRHMPDPIGRPRPDSGSGTVDAAVEDTVVAVGDHLLGLGTGMVRLGQSAVDAAQRMVEVDVA